MVCYCFIYRCYKDFHNPVLPPLLSTRAALADSSSGVASEEANSRIAFSISITATSSINTFIIIILTAPSLCIENMGGLVKGSCKGCFENVLYGDLNLTSIHAMSGQILLLASNPWTSAQCPRPNLRQKNQPNGRSVGLVVGGGGMG